MQRFNLHSIFTGFLILSLFSSIMTPSVWAAGHGCAPNEPDRDGDGTPDKDDPFPDDPTQGGYQNTHCGGRVPHAKLFFVPFNQEISSIMTRGDIENKMENAIWFCSKEDAGEGIQKIVEDAIDGQDPDEANLLDLEFDDRQIRLKLVTMDSEGKEVVIWVDRLGIGMKQSRYFSLTAAELQDIENRITAFNETCSQSKSAECETAKKPL